MELMKITILLSCMMLIMLPLASGYLVVIDPDGPSTDVILATQIVLEIPGGSAVLASEVSESELDESVYLTISDGDVSLFIGSRSDGIVPTGLRRFVTIAPVVGSVVQVDLTGDAYILLYSLDASSRDIIRGVEFAAKVPGADARQGDLSEHEWQNRVVVIVEDGGFRVNIGAFADRLLGHTLEHYIDTGELRSFMCVPGEVRQELCEQGDSRMVCVCDGDGYACDTSSCIREEEAEQAITDPEDTLLGETPANSVPDAGSDGTIGTTSRKDAGSENLWNRIVSFFRGLWRS